MIYLVTGQKDFFGLEGIEYVSAKESLEMLYAKEKHIKKGTLLL